jgi:hypothetical protein
MVKLEQLIDKTIFSQIADKMAGKYDFERHLVPGDNIQVKAFDPLNSHLDYANQYSVCFQFWGLECSLPWDLRNKYSEYKLWRSTDGICYLDVSGPINLHTAHVSDREDKARNATSTIWSLPAVLLSGILSTLSFFRYLSQLVMPKVFLLPL